MKVVAMPINAAQPCHDFENKRHLLDHLLRVEEPLEPAACPDAKGEDGALVTGDDGTLAAGAPVEGAEDDAINTVDVTCDDEGPGVVEDDVRSTGDAGREGSLSNTMADINTNDGCRHE
ncbi:unnamed protein product [Alternaria alternata]